MADGASAGRRRGRRSRRPAGHWPSGPPGGLRRRPEGSPPPAFPGRVL